MSEATRADVCVAAIADCFKGDGEIMVSPMGNPPTLGARLAKSTFEPELVMTDGYNKIINTVLPIDVSPGPEHVEGYMPFEFVFDTLWWGKRHVMMGATQIDQYGNQNIACIGPWKQPKTQLLGVRGAPGNTINHQTSYWIGNHNKRVFVPEVDVVSGVGYNRASELPEVSRRFHEIRRVVTNLGVFDFNGSDHKMRLVSVHPGVELEQIVENTGFDLGISGNVPTSRIPTSEEITVIRRLDPEGKAQKEVVV